MLITQSFLYRILSGLIILSLFYGCNDNSTSSHHVTGTVDFDSAITFENSTSVKIVIEDSSVADLSSIVIASVEISSFDEIPIRYSIIYHPSEIDLTHSYNIRAEVFELNEKEEKVRTYITT